MTDFFENYSLGRGGVFFIEKMYASANLMYSQFSNNYALFGGVFFTQLNGYFQCEQCTITDNFAIYGGVLFS